MDDLLEAVAALVCVISPEKVRAIAARIRLTDVSKATAALSGVVSTQAASGLIEKLIEAWEANTVGAGELASMLRAASHIYTKAETEQSTELVWTGPTTPFVASRRTEQALLQVINSADSTLFITSFVAYDISTIVRALNAAGDRGVDVSILLELSQEHGGTINFDAIGKMKVLVPASRLYAWNEKADAFTDGRVHAKVAVSDGRVCFITSANLTRYAMDRNMEAGVLISGGNIPRLLEEHLNSLSEIKIISQV